MTYVVREDMSPSISGINFIGPYCLEREKQTVQV